MPPYYDVALTENGSFILDKGVIGRLGTEAKNQ